MAVKIARSVLICMLSPAIILSAAVPFGAHAAKPEQFDVTIRGIDSEDDAESKIVSEIVIPKSAAIRPRLRTRSQAEGSPASNTPGGEPREFDLNQSNEGQDFHEGSDFYENPTFHHEEPEFYEKPDFNERPDQQERPQDREERPQRPDRPERQQR